ncbi:MAG TPA: carboxypeptidase-like regulatory domain-containing protein [Candidatus Thermoplasmatota archaeon]|nr:carboxypeptidase-like regulatory domain-containing protein [Candidatus Thermoplasmatota archaeon]
MRPSWIVLAMLAASVVSAGCAGKTADGAPPAEGETSTGPTGVGSLLGVVVDDAVRPLADANVTANGPSGIRNATTDAKGEFRFDGLAAGVYLVQASKPFYISQQQAITVLESAEPETTRFLLTFESSQVPYANLYKVDGFYECGAYPLRICSNVNIATSVVLCAYHPALCLGNVTQDRSLFFQRVEPGLDFLQTEMAWEPTTATGAELGLLLGGGTEEELRGGVNLPAYNASYGPSPIMLRISNHEGEDSWCKQNNQCETAQVVNESKIGTERALLVQVDMGPTFRAMDSCGVPGAYTLEPCGTGFNAQQPYTLFITTFYGYEPPVDWLFSTTGELPPSPPPG